MTFKGTFSSQDLYVKIVRHNGEVVYNTRSVDSSLRIEKNKNQKEYSIIFTQKNYFVGDMTLHLKENRIVGKNLLVSYWFNTAFIDYSKYFMSHSDQQLFS